MINGIKKKKTLGKGSLFHGLTPTRPYSVGCVLAQLSGLPGLNAPHEKGILETHVSFLLCQDLKTGDPHFGMGAIA